MQQRPMFRVKTRIDPDLPRDDLGAVKTGLPGVAWIGLDCEAQWLAGLAGRVPG